MSKNFQSDMQIRNTLAILQTFQNHEQVKLKEKFSKSKCSSLMVSILYDRMMVKALASARSYKHTQMRLPDGVFGKLGTTENFRLWLEGDKYQTDMNSGDLLSIGALSGWHSAWRFLVSKGFVRVNRINRIVIEYPIGDKFYSLDYAGNILRGIIKEKANKKKEKENEGKEQDVEYKDSNPIEEKKKNVPFWEL